MFPVFHDLTHYRLWVDTSATMFSSAEIEAVKFKALEQALRAAALARTDPAPLLPAVSEPAPEWGDWPFRLTQLDVLCLRSCPFPISPA